LLPLALDDFYLLFGQAVERIDVAVDLLLQLARVRAGAKKGSPIRRLVVKRHTPPFVFSFFFSYPTES